ncbi:MAG: ATP-dependent DNA ligase [Acidimicrobiia bacterium]|nr:ATP-dependent DNA ligase [Acidimicrobiia bacterium]
MLLREVVDCSAEVRSTRSRLAKTSAIAGLLGRAEPELVPTVASYLSGELPQGKIGVGYALLYGLDEPAAADPSLTVEHVDRVLTELKAISGAGSKQRRVDILTTLLGAATDAEQDFLRNLIIGELRQGASGGIMEEAVAQAAGVPVGLVRRAAMLNGDLAPVARAALSDGADGLSAFALEVFSPLQPMLAQSAESAAAALERTGPAAVEYKIDGARIQVHHQAGKTQVFSRNLRDVTSQVPNVGEVLAGLGIDSCILDGEAIAVGRSGRPEPFQESMSRFGRQSSGGPLAAYFFDCLHLNGTDLIDEPTPVRAQALAGALPGGLIAPRIETDSAQEATAFFEQAVADGFEGVMVKALYAPYEAGRRGAAWIKVKPVHTLDLVVLAVEWGSGRRQGWLSNLHLGARDPESESFVMLGKTFKGLTDDLLTWQTERFLELETHRDGRTVYVRPEQVVEIAFDGVQRSSRYPGGVALRFARVKGYRDDKDAADADTIETVRGFV